MNVSDVHCRHVLFGGSSDAGYVRQLIPHAMDECVREPITLLEGASFEKAFANLERRLRTRRFDDVFRTEKLGPVSQKVSFSRAPPRSPGLALRIISLPKVSFGQGRLNDAQQLLIRVHDRKVRLLGWSHLYTLNGALSLSCTYKHQGLWEDAARLEQDVVHHVR